MKNSKKKPVIGRPKSDNPRAFKHTVRLNDQEENKFQGDLKESKKEKSDYIREKLLD